MIEVVMVAGIIMILIAVAIPNFIGNRKKARITTAVSTMKSIRSALEVYASDHDEQYPSGITSFASLMAILSPKYMQGDAASITKTLNLFNSYTLTPTGWQMVVTVENQAVLTATEDTTTCTGSEYCP